MVAQSMCLMYRYLRNISIPAAFITRTDGDALKVLPLSTG